MIEALSSNVVAAALARINRDFAAVTASNPQPYQRACSRLRQGFALIDGLG